MIEPFVMGMIYGSEKGKRVCEAVGRVGMRFPGFLILFLGYFSSFLGNVDQQNVRIYYFSYVQ